MNATQRKYAVKKLSEIATKCVSDFQKRNQPTRPDVTPDKELGKLIVAEGLASVVMHPMPKYYQYSSGGLANLFCLESEFEALVYYTEADAVFNTNLNKLKAKTESALESATDKIMLGNDALKAIADFKLLVSAL